MGRLDDKIFETISAGLVYLDADLNIVEHNLLGLRAIGAEVSFNLVGKPFFDVLTNHSAGLRIAFQKVISEQKQRVFWGYPVSLPGRSEKTFWDYTISNLDEGVLLSAVEVTDRVNAEHGLQDAVENARQAADKFRLVIEQMSDGVIVCEAKGKIVNINNAAEKMLGESVLQLILENDKEYSDLIRKTDGKRFLAKDYPWHTACSDGEQSTDVEMLVRQGKERSAIIHVNASPLFDKNNLKTGAVAVLRDVTENRYLIDELRKANFQLEEYNRLKAEFVANMSHELRTPLTAIIGFAQLMQMKSGKQPENANETISDGLERILRNGRHLLTLIDEVLDLSKIEAGRLTLHLEHFDLAEMIEKTFSGLESLALQKGLQYNLKVSRIFPLVFSDPARIRQIVLNLLSNAIKFTQKGGIQVSLETIDNKEWSLSVKDSGLGIKAENLDSIFERFRQVDGSFTRTAGGFGLGLSISQQLAALLGGKITITSEYGKGSTFTLTLPYTAPSATEILNTRGKTDVEVSLSELSSAAPNENTPLNENDSRQTVLIVDDLPDSTRLLTNTLESAGYRVVIANSGSEGILMARRLNPDAITLDIMMPGMDGWRVLQEMKSDPELAKIPVIVVSIVDNKPLAYRLGASSYLVKPVAPENLLQTLNTVVAPANDNKGYVLVVDDELGVRELLISALKQGGFKTFSASSGEIALAQAAKRPPLAILTDLHMPGGMTGYELIARLRSQPPTSQIPIIVITGKDLMAEDRHFISGQIADVIRKGDLMLTDLSSRLRESLAEIGVEPTNGENSIN